MAYFSPYLGNGFRKHRILLPTMILILLLIQLTSGCVFTNIARRNQLTEQCKLEALRGYLNAIARVSFTRVKFRVKAGNCTAHLRPFMPDSTPLIHFEVYKADEDAPTATLCLSKHIDNEWLLHAICKVF